VIKQADYYLQSPAEPSAGESGAKVYLGQLKFAPALNAVSKKPGNCFVLDAASTLCVSFF
jgi:hypothetical protein